MAAWLSVEDFNEAGVSSRCGPPRLPKAALFVVPAALEREVVV